MMLLLAFASNAQADSGRKSDEERIMAATAKAMKGDSSLSAAKLNELIKNKEPGYMIISLQSPEEYRNGHIPGAVHLPIDLADLPGALKQLPKDKTIAVVSANGQEACKITLVLRQLGYEAKNVMLGMNAYNRLYAGAGAYLGDIDGKISTEAGTLPPASPQPTYSDGLSDEALILRNTEAYAKLFRPFNITAYDLLAARDDAVLISMQMPADYAKGHIPGTINIPGPDFLAGDQRLLQLPKDKKIIVTCYIGHYSSLGTMMLNQMGYEAYSLTWGLSGWNIEALGDEIKTAITKGFGFETVK